MKNAAWNNAPLDMDLLFFVVVVEKPEVVQYLRLDPLMFCFCFVVSNTKVFRYFV